MASLRIVYGSKLLSVSGLQELASPRNRLRWPSIPRPLRQWLRPFKAHSGFTFHRLSETDMQSNVLG